MVKGLREAGLSVPGDVSVVGFDDIALAALVQPPLTTVAQPIDEIGRRGAEALIQRVRQGAGAVRRPLVLASRLVVRESAGAPRGGTG